MDPTAASVCELRPPRVKAQLDRVNGLYTKVQHLLEAAQDSTESSDAIKLAVSNLKSALRTYDAESKILTGYYASAGKRCLFHTERILRRHCSVDDLTLAWRH